MDIWSKLWTLYPDGWLYQQDNAPPHTAKATQQWFRDQNITVISWPPGSPDLNPIEIMWAIMKQRLESENVKNLTELKEKVLSIWEEFDMDLVKSLIGRLPEFIQKCILAEGATINL